MVKDFFYYVPVKLVFGEGSLSKTGEYAAAYGSKALIVTTGTFFKESGLVDRLKGILEDDGIDAVYFPDVDPNPLNTQIDAGAAIAKAENVDMFIGLGGGSAIDAAKAMAVARGHDSPIWNFCTGDDAAEITEKTYPIIAITTTSGTGSEGTQWSVITNKDVEKKPGIGNDYTFAKVAVVDPELMVSMPTRINCINRF